MKKTTLGLIFLFVLMAAGISQASTLTMVGPALPYTISGWDNAGMQFKALKDLTLTSFVLNNQGSADTVWLQNGTGSILQTYYSPSSDPMHLASGLSWSLYEGETYRLILDGSSNGKWNTFSDYPMSNDHIEVQGIAYGSEVYTNYWFDFSNITTTDGAGSNAVPEPATLALFGVGLTGLAFRKRKA